MTPEERAAAAWEAFVNVELAGEPHQLQKAFKAVVVTALREAVAAEQERLRRVLMDTPIYHGRPGAKGGAPKTAAQFRNEVLSQLREEQG